MYWLIEYDPESGLETTEFKSKIAAFKMMKARYDEHKTDDRYGSCERTGAYVDTDLGTFEWQIVGSNDSNTERILARIEDFYGKDFLSSEEMAYFYIEHWDEYECAMDIDSYAYLNTLFGYDIGSDNARQISNWLYEKFGMTTEGIPGGDDADNLMRVAKWNLKLDLDFSNFNADIEEIRYDW